MHTPGACAPKSMHPAVFQGAHFYINILKKSGKSMHLPDAQVGKCLHLASKLQGSRKPVAKSPMATGVQIWQHEM